MYWVHNFNEPISNYQHTKDMKKYYNIPATEVVAFMGGFIMQSVSPTPGPTPPIYPANPNGYDIPVGGEA